MQILPDDMLDLISNHCPKTFRSVSKRYRDRFNIYNHWIYLDRVFKKEIPYEFCPCSTKCLPAFLEKVLFHPIAPINIERIKYIIIDRFPSVEDFLPNIKMIRGTFVSEKKLFAMENSDEKHDADMICFRSNCGILMSPKGSKLRFAFQN